MCYRKDKGKEMCRNVKESRISCYIFQNLLILVINMLKKEMIKELDFALYGCSSLPHNIWHQMSLEAYF